MKKLSQYIFLFLIWCNVGFTATLISLNDLKLNANIDDYFFNQEITEFNYEGDGYGSSSNYSLLFIPLNKPTILNKEADGTMYQSLMTGVELQGDTSSDNRKSDEG